MKNKIPWYSCKISFLVRDRENVWELNDGRLPDGWKIVSTIPIDRVESSFSVTFEIKDVPSIEDGERVLELLRKVGAIE